MNIQERLIEASSALRARASALTTVALDVARERSDVAAKRVDLLKGSIATLTVAGRELNKVAQRHAERFVKENSAIAVAAGKDFGILARATYAKLSGRKVSTKAHKARKSSATTGRRATSKAA